MLLISNIPGIDIISNSVNLPEAPEMPITQWNNIVSLWDFSDAAFEVTSVIQNILGRLPPYFLAYFAISFLFIVIGLLISLINHIL